MISLQNERWCTCVSKLNIICTSKMQVKVHICITYMYNVIPVSFKPVEVSVLRSMAFFSESVKPSTAVSQRWRYSRKVSCSH